MDPVDKKKTVKYFFDTAPACRNERVNMIRYDLGILVFGILKLSYDHCLTPSPASEDLTRTVTDIKHRHCISVVDMPSLLSPEEGNYYEQHGTW